MRQQAISPGCGGSIAQLEHAIATVEVKRPSTQLAPGAAGDRGTTERQLARGLRGDLDAIVLKALAPSPASRYDSARAFADDLQRSLSGEPVAARPDRLGYRCQVPATAPDGTAIAAIAAVTIVCGRAARL
jgi:hypothetical protein